MGNIKRKWRENIAMKIKHPSSEEWSEAANYKIIYSQHYNFFFYSCKFPAHHWPQSDHYANSMGIANTLIQTNPRDEYR